VGNDLRRPFDDARRGKGNGVALLLFKQSIFSGSIFFESRGYESMMQHPEKIRSQLDGKFNMQYTVDKELARAIQ